MGPSHANVRIAWLNVPSVVQKSCIENVTYQISENSTCAHKKCTTNSFFQRMIEDSGKVLRMKSVDALMSEIA